MQVKNFKTLLVSLIGLSIYGVSLTHASDFNELVDDCVTFNLDTSCQEPPKQVIKPPQKKKAVIHHGNYIKDELLIVYPKSETSNLEKITQRYNLKTTSKVLLSSVNTGLLVAKTNGQDPLSLSKTVNQQEKNIKASTNNIYKLATTTFQKAYSLFETGVNTVHKTTKGQGVSVCMIDTPVDIFHPSFTHSRIETIDLIEYDPNNLDMMAHGTSVAGVLVSQNDLIGVAPKAKLLAISAFSTSKHRPFSLQGSSANIAKAINICINNRVDVINLSFTGNRDSLIEPLIEKAISKGIVVVAAGGNGGHWGSTIYPALIPGVLAVTAVDDNKQLFSMADKGRFIDYSAPGVNILTLAPSGKYTLATGTSLSSAHLSGIVALLLSEQRRIPIDKTLKQTAVDLGKPGRDQEYGEGLVSANRALATLKIR